MLYPIELGVRIRRQIQVIQLQQVKGANWLRADDENCFS